MNYLKLPEAENVLYKALVQKHGILKDPPNLEGFCIVGLAPIGIENLLTEPFGEGEFPLIYRQYRMPMQETPADENTFVAIHRHRNLTGNYLVTALRTLQDWERVGNDISGAHYSLDNALDTANRILSGEKIGIDSEKEPLRPQDKLRLEGSVYPQDPPTTYKRIPELEAIAEVDGSAWKSAWNAVKNFNLYNIPLGILEFIDFELGLKTYRSNREVLLDDSTTGSQRFASTVATTIGIFLVNALHAYTIGSLILKGQFPMDIYAHIQAEVGFNSISWLSYMFPESIKKRNKIGSQKPDDNSDPF